MKLNKIIKDRLTEYIEFDISNIINIENDYASVFGGSVRDSIANKEIHDVDILCLRKSLINIEKTLLSEGYINHEKFCVADMHILYREIRCIFEPHTWIKGQKIIQLIVPCTDDIKKSADEKYLINNFNFMLGQVDISCCGVNFNVNGLNESIDDAILHCMANVFIKVEGTKMFDFTRFHKRKDKLLFRGWKSIDDMKRIEIEKIFKPFMREKKLNRILQ